MKTFQQFLLEAMQSKSADDSQLDKAALAMWKALKFNDSDSNQQVYKILHQIDKFYKNLDHDKWTLDGAEAARSFTIPENIFWILETCRETDDIGGRIDDDETLTLDQAYDDDDFDPEYNVILTDSGTYVYWDYNIAYNDKEINNLNEDKVKKIIKMMCDLHHVKYNEEVFKKFKPEDFTNASNNPIEMHE